MHAIPKYIGSRFDIQVCPTSTQTKSEPNDLDDPTWLQRWCIFSIIMALTLAICSCSVEFTIYRYACLMQISLHAKIRLMYLCTVNYKY